MRWPPRSGALRSTVRELDGVLGDAPAALAAIDRSLPPLERFTARLRPSLRIAAPVLRDTARLLGQLRGLSRPSELPRLVRRLVPALTELPRLETRLAGLFALVTPVTDCVRERAQPVLRAAVPDGEHTTGRPVWQNVAHIAVGLASASQSFDGNGFSVRYLVGGGPRSFSAQSGSDTLFGSTENAIVGARPRWLGTGVSPQFRPDQRCVDQALPDLKSRTDQTPAVKRALGRGR